VHKGEEHPCRIAPQTRTENEVKELKKCGAMKKILIAGIGNIFLGDDAFGCEVVRQLSSRHWPGEVRVTDFGIRSYDLAYALAGKYDVVILVDATPQGAPPGTVYLIEPDLARLTQFESATANPHGMDPVQVLQMAGTPGGEPARLYLVGCEPGSLQGESGWFGLSAPVQAAVPKAVGMIESIVGNLLKPPTQTNAGRQSPRIC
jgi:hydrogenase maturation protease